MQAKLFTDNYVMLDKGVPHSPYSSTAEYKAPTYGWIMIDQQINEFLSPRVEIKALILYEVREK